MRPTPRKVITAGAGYFLHAVLMALACMVMLGILHGVLITFLPILGDLNTLAMSAMLFGAWSGRFYTRPGFPFAALIFGGMGCVVAGWEFGLVSGLGLLAGFILFRFWAGRRVRVSASPVPRP